MRTRKAPPAPPGFVLDLPPPSVGDEVPVQQRTELVINVDDANISPIITMEGELPSGKFVHVSNTNLFVLIDGMSTLTEGKGVHKEDVKTGHVVAPGTSLTPEKISTPIRPPICDTAVDSIKEAIRDIERENNDVFPELTSSCSILPASGGPTPTNLIPVANTRWNRIKKRCYRNCGVVARSVVPPQYAALFNSNRNQTHITGIYYGVPLGECGSVRGRMPVAAGAVRGFLPRCILSEADEAILLREPNKPNNASSKGGSIVSATVSHSSTSSLPIDAVSVKPDDKTKNEKYSKQRQPLRSNRKSSSSDEIGRTNRSFNLEDVVVLELTGKGTQGAVYRVRLDNMLYALKCIDMKEVIEATSQVEQQSRKRGLVKELQMIRLQRSRKEPGYLLRLFHASVTLNDEKQQLHILMELMSFSVEDAQLMVSRIPHNEIMKLTQSTFRHHMTRSDRFQQKIDKLFNQPSASCRRLLGRHSYKVPEDWETGIDRQTPVPEVILSMLAADVLNGLRELHDDYSIVHCDIKPANILLDYDMMRFRLADFGCGCLMNPHNGKVQQVTVDLGSKLYKAPERLQDELYTTTSLQGGASHVEFTAAADVWSLGVTLLELSNGVHPCYPFKSDYWNYRNNLRLSCMVKPLSWSALLGDFIVRCLMINAEDRWTVNMLLLHPFIERFSNVPREKLKVWMSRLKSVSETFQRRRQRELLEEHILLSTGMKGPDMYRHRSRSCWEKFTMFLKVAPHFQDDEKFPHLR
uniref:mitogen-activated protein kinase kinase n=1 Tax=Trypanosoma congolense (strain IL3000) TaxID=1068625 RepID=G0V2R9_TRYCI|nr:unnamed protein product [Trypanosoma congolense IL3000]